MQSDRLRAHLQPKVMFILGGRRLNASGQNLPQWLCVRNQTLPRKRRLAKLSKRR
jgi:hypothetical protein